MNPNVTASLSFDPDSYELDDETFRKLIWGETEDLAAMLRHRAKNWRREKLGQPQKFMPGEKVVAAATQHHGEVLGFDVQDDGRRLYTLSGASLQYEAEELRYAHGS